MAQQKRRNPIKPQPRTWTIPRFLLIIGYGMVLAFLGTLFLMRQELMRVGIFGGKPVTSTPAPVPLPEQSPQVRTEPQPPAVVPPQVTTEDRRPISPSPPQVTSEAQLPEAAPPSPKTSASRHSGEITSDEKQALDDILRSKR